LRTKKVEKLHNSSFYRNFRKLNPGIGFRNRERLFPVLSIIKKKNKKLIPTDRPLIFLTCDSKHTYIFFWPEYPRILIFTCRKWFNVRSVCDLSLLTLNLCLFSHYNKWIIGPIAIGQYLKSLNFYYHINLNKLKWVWKSNC
jgi:hypothetical protein